MFCEVISEQPVSVLLLQEHAVTSPGRLISSFCLSAPLAKEELFAVTANSKFTLALLLLCAEVGRKNTEPRAMMEDRTLGTGMI